MSLSDPGPHVFRVVGLDLSVTSTGMSDGLRHRVRQTSTDHVIEHRMFDIVEAVESFVMSPDGKYLPADLVVIEGGAFGRGAQSEAAEWLAALRYAVRMRMFWLRIPFAMVPPATLKAYTTGRGDVTKSQMVAAVAERHGVDLSDVKVKDGKYDLADAVALAAMGYAHLNDPIPTTGPPAPVRSLLAVKWPDRPAPFTVEG